MHSLACHYKHHETSWEASADSSPASESLVCQSGTASASWRRCSHSARNLQHRPPPPPPAAASSLPAAASWTAPTMHRGVCHITPPATATCASPARGAPRLQLCRGWTTTQTRQTRRSWRNTEDARRPGAPRARRAPPASPWTRWSRRLRRWRSWRTPWRPVAAPRRSRQPRTKSCGHSAALCWTACATSWTRWPTPTPLRQASGVQGGSAAHAWRPCPPAHGAGATWRRLPRAWAGVSRWRTARRRCLPRLCCAV